ncbi:hypothetical protein AB0I16_13980 [Streptomyces sp. NPDC050703]
MLRAFLHGPPEGGMDVADGEGGLRTLRVVAAGYASARSGKPVTVD